MKLIYLEWVDAQSYRGWLEDDRAIDWAKKSEWTVKQAGFLLEENKDYICIAGQYDDEDPYKASSFACLVKIPKPWITKRVDLSKYIK